MTDERLEAIADRLDALKPYDNGIPAANVRQAYLDDIAALLREVRALQERLSADFARAGECVG